MTRRKAAAIANAPAIAGTPSTSMETPVTNDSFTETPASSVLTGFSDLPITIPEFPENGDGYPVASLPMDGALFSAMLDDLNSTYDTAPSRDPLTMSAITFPAVTSEFSRDAQADKDAFCDLFDWKAAEMDSIWDSQAIEGNVV